MDHIDIVRRYIAARRDGRIEDALAFVAEDIVLINPVIGTFTGKAAVAKFWRVSPGGGARPENLTFSEPAIEGEIVRLPGVSPFGPIRILFSFNAADEITRIDIGLAT